MLTSTKNMADAMRKSTLHNVFDLGKVPYVAATVNELTIGQYFALYTTTICRVLFVCLMSVPWVLKGLLHFIIPRHKKNVHGQTALVTGAGNGIGKAIALRLAREGCNIAVADLDMAAANQTVLEIKQMNVDARAYLADVSKPADVQKLHADIQRDMGGAVDILINNAGFMSLMSVREGSDEEMDRMIKLNLYSHLYTIRTFLPDMIKRRRGHVVGMSSMSGLHPTPNLVIYTATKFSIYGLMEGLSAELRQEGLGEDIHFTTVHPYFVSTRQDIMDAVNLVYPPVTTERVANETVDAMLRNESAITVPQYLYYSASLFRIMPDRVQGMVRDYLLCEKGVKQVHYRNEARANGNGVAVMANGNNNYK